MDCRVCEVRTTFKGSPYRYYLLNENVKPTNCIGLKEGPTVPWHKGLGEHRQGIPPLRKRPPGSWGI
jgi:hypothetical protein